MSPPWLWWWPSPAAGLLALAMPKTSSGDTSPRPIGTTAAPGRRRGASCRSTPSRASLERQSALLIKTRSAASSCSPKSSSISLAWSRLGSERRWASRAAGLATTAPAARASPSTTATTPLSLIRVRISGQFRAAIRGSGRAKPLVSTTMPSRLSARSSSRSMVGRNSS